MRYRRTYVFNEELSDSKDLIYMPDIIDYWIGWYLNFRISKTNSLNKNLLGDNILL